MKVIEVKKGFPAIDGAPEIKVPGKIYMPEIKAVAAQEDSYVVSLSQTEINMLHEIVGNASSAYGVYNLWKELGLQVRNQKFKGEGMVHLVPLIPR